MRRWSLLQRLQNHNLLYYLGFSDFLTAKAPLRDRSVTYRGLQGRGLRLDFFTARAPLAWSLALTPYPAVFL